MTNFITQKPTNQKQVTDKLYHRETNQSETSHWQTLSQRNQPILDNFIICDCESSAPFFVIYKAMCEPTLFFKCSEIFYFM
jgi:hypothetical protein